MNAKIKLIDGQENLFKRGIIIIIQRGRLVESCNMQLVSLFGLYILPPFKTGSKARGILEKRYRYVGLFQSKIVTLFTT